MSNKKTHKDMDNLNKKDNTPNLKVYYLEFKRKNIDEDNKEQFIYLEKKMNKAISLAKKFSKREGFSRHEFNLTQLYIFLFHFRLIDTFAEKSIPKDDPANNQVKKIIFKDQIYKDFNLSLKDQTELNNALEEYTIPVGKKSIMPIKLGHDAITSVFGKKKIIEYLNDELDEFEFYFPSLFDSSEKLSEVLDYMIKTRYYSIGGKDKNLPRKIKNKNTVIKFIQKQKAASSIVNNKRAMTMVKTSSRNQIDLISIADKKAGIMITVNSILLTILIPLFASYIFDLSSYIIPIIILVVTCGLTILLATLATRPSANPDKEANSEKLNTGESSIFYFKNFAQLPKDKFVVEAHELLHRDAAFEKAVFTDLYDVGIDLDRKYVRLRWCYTIFASGIVLTILSLLFCIIYFAAT